MNPFQMQASSGGGDFEACPAGTHPAVLVGLLDIGTYSEQFQGQPPKDARKVLLVWEVIVDDARHYVGRDYTLSFNQKATLRQLVEKWRGKAFGDDEGFDLSVLVGKPCLISIVHKTSGSGNTYGRVDGVMSLPKGMPAPTASHPPVVWSVMSGGPVPDADWLPYLRGKPLQEVIKTCKERNGGVSVPPQTQPQHTADEVAF